MKESIKIAINAQIRPNIGFGGVEQALIGLIAALGKLENDREDYIIIGPWQEPDWFKQFLGPNQRIIRGQKQSSQEVRKTQFFMPFKRVFAPVRLLGRTIYQELLSPPSPRQQWPEVPISDGFYENIGCDVIHFPFQELILCALPIIYNPHDLQHLHYPQFFTPAEIAWRETIYRAGCHLAHTVVVGSRWVKQDLLYHYRVHPDKIQVISWAPYTQVCPVPKPDELAAVQASYNLELPFAFYPAMTWKHKNHIRLLEALARLRDCEGLIVHLVCTGNRDHDFWPQIEEHIRTLNLHDQVRFLGIVPPNELRAIYHLSEFVVLPSLFEGGSLPMLECWLEGTPLTCSTATMLPEQAGDAALLFNPESIPAIANAILRMKTDANLRAELVRKGQQRLQAFNWERTAKAYRAVYRRAARCSLTEEDRRLLGRNRILK